jgi:hypothetical protein
MGAVDSFLKSVVHVRPYVVNSFEEAADGWMNAWFAEGGANVLEAVDGAWTNRYLASLSAAERVPVQRFLHAFFRWAVQENLVDAHPLRAE